MRLRGADGGVWEQVRLLGQRWEAEMIQGFLESHGIATWLNADDGGGSVYPGASWLGYPLLVPVEQVESARQLLAAGTEADDSGDEDDEDWDFGDAWNVGDGQAADLDPEAGEPDEDRWP